MSSDKIDRVYHGTCKLMNHDDIPDLYQQDLAVLYIAELRFWPLLSPTLG